jgi:hypothetical protein
VQQEERLFDHLVGKRKQRRRDFEVKCLSSFAVKDELELVYLLNWQVSGFDALKNATHVNPPAVSVPLATSMSVDKRRCQPTNPAAELTARGPNKMSGVISSTVLQPQYTMVLSSSLRSMEIALAAPASPPTDVP